MINCPYRNEKKKRHTYKRITPLVEILEQLVHKKTVSINFSLSNISKRKNIFAIWCFVKILLWLPKEKGSGKG